MEERKELLDHYLLENKFIQRSTYLQLTGLLKDLSLKDLNNWVKEEELKADGKKGGRIHLPGKSKPDVE